MKKILIAAALVGISSASSSFGAIPQPVDEALLMVGTGAHGHTYPGATVPFGFVQLSPDTPVKGWDACAGYHYSDSSILGFSHTHLSGTGIGDLGDVLVLPITGKLQESTNYQALTVDRLRSGFSHDNEFATPGYYRVMLDKYNVLAELTATAHAGMHRYTFPASKESHILVDLVHGVNNQVTDAVLKIENKKMITGQRTTSGWDKHRTIYFAIECLQPWKSFGLEADGKPLPPDQTEIKSKNVRLHLDFKTSADQKILLRVGLSATSVEEAKKNLQMEIPSWDFDAIRLAARNTWNEQLSSIKIESPNPNIRQTFYSALYHSMTTPNLYNDADGSYRGPDGEVHTNSGFQYYSTFSLWDTYRAEHPLLTLVQPGRVNDFVQSLLTFYTQGSDKRLPMWVLAGSDTGTMIGYHAVPVIADAYAKGFRGFDAELALNAMRDTAMNDRNRQDEYTKQGYVSSETGKGWRGTARTLEFAFDDWCIAQMATALGKTDDAALFNQRAQNFTNVFDPETKFFRGKTAAGAFREPFDPKSFSPDDYAEANTWQYTFAVFHDVPGMIKLYGGNEAFIKKLDELFLQDSDIHRYIVDFSGLMGHYAHGNEPCHHVPYLYAFAGAQYKTALRAHQIMLLQYDNTPTGICGNDDCGQMSAWYVWSAIGLYPVNPADGKYIIGSPLVEKATIQLDSKFYPGGKFTIVAHNASNQNIYVQSAKLNGEPINRPWITHTEIVKGGTLELEMGILPNESWGTDVN
ncbi:MAG TPA: GH92 family glycosyl hydrolase [Methylomirabilota bacterium]|nr:GH92 family glycosyl hydrolase [Methylomirabilota bacterium]